MKKNAPTAQLSPPVPASVRHPLYWWRHPASRRSNLLGFLTGLLWGASLGTWATLQAATQRVEVSALGSLLTFVPMAFMVAALFTKKGSLPRQFIGWAGMAAPIGYAAAFVIVASRLIAQ